MKNESQIYLYIDADKNMPQEGNAIIPTPPLESSISLTPTIVSLEVCKHRYIGLFYIINIASVEK